MIGDLRQTYQKIFFGSGVAVLLNRRDANALASTSWSLVRNGGQFFSKRGFLLPASMTSCKSAMDAPR